MAGQYAQNTEVSADRSRAEIEKTVSKYGATEYGYGWQAGQAVIMFTLSDRQMRFILSLPDREEFRLTPTGRARTATSITEAWEQACRASWRSLALVIKAKLEAVAADIVTLEQEFAMHMVIPGTGGRTLGEMVIPSIASAYAEGSPAPILSALTGRELTTGKDQS